MSKDFAEEDVQVIMSDKLPQRKNLRLVEYDYSQNGCYFVTLCTHNRQKVFEISTVGNDLCVVPSSAPQNKIIEKWICETQVKFNINIDVYIIMPDHLHFILSMNAERHAGRSL